MNFVKNLTLAARSRLNLQASIDLLLLTWAYGNLVFVSILAGGQGLNSKYAFILNSISLYGISYPSIQAFASKRRHFKNGSRDLSVYR